VGTTAVNSPAFRRSATSRASPARACAFLCCASPFAHEFVLDRSFVLAAVCISVLGAWCGSDNGLLRIGLAIRRRLLGEPCAQVAVIDDAGIADAMGEQEPAAE